MRKRYLAMLLVIVMAVSLCPAIPVFAADGQSGPVESVYGFLTENAEIVDGSKLSVTMVKVGESTPQTYETAPITAHNDCVREVSGAKSQLTFSSRPRRTFLSQGTTKAPSPDEAFYFQISIIALFSAEGGPLLFPCRCYVPAFHCDAFTITPRHFGESICFA